jgi:hypothetical protein
MNAATAVLLSVLVLHPAAAAQVVTTGRVPPAVTQAWQRRFPGVRRVEWKIKSDRNYEAEFTRQGADIAAKFDSAGTWLETESAISRSRLPEAVRRALAARFGGHRIVETQILERRDAPHPIYEVHVENATETVKVELTADGGVVSQSAKAKPAGSSPRRRLP